MSEAQALSPIHRDLLRDMAESGRPLVRWQGGYWTTEERGAGQRRDWPSGYHLPARFVSIGIVRELEAKGLVQRLGTDAEEWRDARVLTEYGRRMGALLLAGGAFGGPPGAMAPHGPDAYRASGR